MSRSWWQLPRIGLRPLAVSLAFASIAAACSTAQLKQSPAPGGSPEGSAEGQCSPEESCESLSPSPGLDAGRTPTVDGGALPMSSAVTIQVQPSDNGAALLAAIRGAKKSVHMTMYLLSNKKIIDALGDLKEAGKDVRVVLNKTFPPNGGDNMPAYDALAARGVLVQWAPSAYTFTHAKTIIVDSEKVIIMTMNLTYSSASTNREYIATDSDPEDVANAEALFDADYENKTVSMTSKLVISPAGANTLEPRTHITALIDSATTSLDIEAQSLSDDGILDAIVRAHQAKVAVRVVIDGDTSDSPGELEAIAKLKQYGVPLRSLKNPDMHAKAIVVDEVKTFIGSQNMTGTALFKNREVGLITDAKPEATKVRAVIAADFENGTTL